MNIRRYRQARLLSLRKLASICRIHHSNISKIERGEVGFRLRTLDKIATALNVPAHLLLLTEKDIEIIKK